MEIADLHPGVLLFLEERKGWMPWGVARSELEPETAAVYAYCRAISDRPEDSGEE